MSAYHVKQNRRYTKRNRGKPSEPVAGKSGQENSPKLPMNRDREETKREVFNRRFTQIAADYFRSREEEDISHGGVEGAKKEDSQPLAHKKNAGPI